jgi:dTDP-4-amino-4,6-dideoxygalactose transaminase
MTSGTWARHTGATTTYDVVGLGFNYRIDEVRSAILLSRLARLESDVERRRELARSYRRELGRIDGLLLPYTDDQVDRSSCDMMTVIVEEPGRRDRVREHLRTESGIQTSVHFPAVHTVSAFRKPAGEQPSLPRTEAASDSVLTLPMFPHLTNEQQERVVLALEEALRA